eukprot:782176-Rhodomonas_salina.1
MRVGGAGLSGAVGTGGGGRGRAGGAGGGGGVCGGGACDARRGPQHPHRCHHVRLLSPRRRSLHAVLWRCASKADEMLQS